MRFRFWVSVLAACCTLLAGCAVPGDVKTTVKIGLSAPFEGLYRDLGYEVLNAVRLAVRQRNQAGGIGGHYLVEQVSLNDLNEAVEAAQQAREMAVDPGILGVLGGWSLQTARAAGPAYEQLGVAFVTPEMDPGRLGEAAARVAAARVAARAEAEGGRLTAAMVLHSADPADLALAQAFADAFVLQGGVIAETMTPAGDDWVRAIGGGEAQPPDVIFIAADTLTAADWIVAVREAGFEGLLVGGPSLGSSIVVDIAGEASDGALFASPFPPATGDPAFVDAYRDLSGGAVPGPAAGWAYGAANRLLDSMDRAAKAHDPSLRAAVQKTWAAGAGDPGPIYTYVIQSGNVYTPYLR